MINHAMGDIKHNTCVKFRLRGNESIYVRIHAPPRDEGCSAWVGPPGKGKGNVSEVMLSHSCFSHPPTVIHELLHSVGLLHEQSRHDRDRYVTVKLGRLQAEDGSKHHGNHVISVFN